MTGGEHSEPRSRSPFAFAAPRSAMRSSLASLAPTVQYADVAAERRALGIASVHRQRRTVADVTGLGRLRSTAGPWLLDGGRTDVPAFRRSHIPTFRRNVGMHIPISMYMQPPSGVRTSGGAGTPDAGRVVPPVSVHGWHVSAQGHPSPRPPQPHSAPLGPMEGRCGAAPEGVKPGDGAPSVAWLSPNLRLTRPIDGSPRQDVADPPCRPHQRQTIVNSIAVNTPIGRRQCQALLPGKPQVAIRDQSEATR